MYNSCLKVVKVTVLLPNVYNAENDNDEKMELWKEHNRLDLLLPGIALAAQKENSTMQRHKPFPTFHDILPGWKIEIEAADTICDSAIGALEAVRLRCETGSEIINIPYNHFLLFQY